MTKKQRIIQKYEDVYLLKEYNLEVKFDFNEYNITNFPNKTNKDIVRIAIEYLNDEKKVADIAKENGVSKNKIHSLLPNFVIYDKVCKHCSSDLKFKMPKKDFNKDQYIECKNCGHKFSFDNEINLDCSCESCKKIDFDIKQQKINYYNKNIKSVDELINDLDFKEKLFYYFFFKNKKNTSSAFEEYFFNNNTFELVQMPIESNNIYSYFENKPYRVLHCSDNYFTLKCPYSNMEIEKIFDSLSNENIIKALPLLFYYDFLKLQEETNSYLFNNKTYKEIEKNFLQFFNIPLKIIVYASINIYEKVKYGSLKKDFVGNLLKYCKYLQSKKNTYYEYLEEYVFFDNIKIIGEKVDGFKNVFNIILNSSFNGLSSSKKIIKEEIINSVDLCPKCGGKLVVKNGKNGEFLGCEFYPFCDFTKNKPS